MLFFRNDYGEGCIEPIMKLLQESNEESHPGYGEDDYTEKAIALLKSKMPETDVDIHFIATGTLANLTMIRHILRPYELVIAADTAHIFVHEAGAIEASGHKIRIVTNANGKLSAASIEKKYLEIVEDPNYYMQPRMVYLSNATEVATVYTRKELEDIRAVCDHYGLYLLMDGARVGAALMSGVDYSLNDLAKWCDIFSIGGTKNGALFGEAIVISNPALKPYFRYIQKQSGALLAKGWLMGLQFIGLFEHDAFYQCAAHANRMAQDVQDEIIKLGYPLYMKSTTNQVFVVLNPVQYEYLKSRVDFEIWGQWDNDIIIRLVASWHTTEEETDYLKVYLHEAMKLSLEEAKSTAAAEEEDELTSL